MGKLPLPESAPRDVAGEPSHERETSSEQDEVGNFRRLMERLLTVPREELAAQEERWKAERKDRSR